MEAMGDGTELTEEVAIFVDHDWFTVVGCALDSLTVAVNVENKTKEVGNIQIKNGEVSPECINMDDTTLIPFREMRVQKLEKRRLHVELGEFGTTYFAPVVNFSDVHPTSILSIDVNCTGKLAVSSATDGSVRIWNAENGNLVRMFDGDNMDVNKVRFFPSGLVVLSCGEDMSVRVLSAETGLCCRTFHGHTRGVQDIGIIGVGKDVLSAAKDGTVKMWNCASSECLHTYNLKQGGANAIALSSVESGTLLCSVAAEEGTSLLDVRSSDIIRLFNTKNDECTAICFDSEKNQIFVGSEKGVIMAYDIRNRKFARCMQTYRSEITCFSKPCKDILYVSFRDGSVCGYEKTLKRRSAVLCFSGADCDPVYDISMFNDTYLYSCCRDRFIRKYEIVV